MLFSQSRNAGVRGIDAITRSTKDYPKRMAMAQLIVSTQMPAFRTR